MAEPGIMTRFCDNVRTEDWKKEKHVPVIELPSKIVAGQPMIVQVSVGKEIPHPNTTEHHIQWIHLYFKPEGDQYMYDLGGASFDAHGASTKGANTGPCYTFPQAIFTVSLEKPGTLIAMEQCNIHGPWESSAEVRF